MDGPTPGRLLKEARRRRGVSQARLAIRAGTTQSAISRIESDRVSPSVETLRSLLQLLGEDLVLETRERETGIDRDMTRANLSLDTAARVRRGLAFADQVIENSPAWRRRKAVA
jgi:transcriptional regulator with XRE-family HTH domain